jgi:mannosyltransferase
MAELLSEPFGNKQPLYFVLLHFWSQIFGESETSVRFLSALIGLMTVVATYGLCSLVGNGRTGLGAAFLVAVSPVLLWYSQETRMNVHPRIFLVRIVASSW